MERPCNIASLSKYKTCLAHHISPILTTDEHMLNTTLNSCVSPLTPTAVDNSYQLTLTKQLVSKLTKLLPSQDLDEQLVVAIVCLACLARRSICPVSFYGSPVHRLLDEFSKSLGNSPFKVDHTDFGHILTEFIAPLIEEKHIVKIKDKIRHLVFETPPELFDDPLLPGWAYQFILKRQASLSDTSPPKVSCRNSRAQDVALSHLNVLTQWFTPHWITQFLIEQALPQPTERILTKFFDPACGAGHVLVEALRQLVKNRLDSNQPDLETALRCVLSEEMFGVDIDMNVVRLAGYAIYLLARDLIPDMIPLPIPHLYSFSSTDGSDQSSQALGSLCLGIYKTQSDIQLTGLDRRTHNPDILPKQFTAVATNPPYLSHRLMPSLISRCLKEHYGASRYDLYAAFLDLGVRLTRPGGKIAMICQQSFLSIQRYAKLRSILLETCDIESIAQLGSGSFATKGGEKVNSAIVVLHKRQSHRNLRLAQTRCWRILTKKDKELAEKKGITKMPCSLIDSDSVRSLKISSAPFIFWCPPDIASLFHGYPPLQSKETYIRCVNGLFTCDNRRFLRTFKQLDGQDAIDYVPYDKGGGRKWFHATPYQVYWRDNGNAIRQYRLARGQSVSLPGESYYFKPGVTYSYIGTRGFKARLLSDGSIFDIASSALFSDKISNLYILGFLNSSLVRFLLGILNPTINYQIGDIRRLPFCCPPEELTCEIESHAKEAVALGRQLETYHFDSPIYEGPALLRYLPRVLSSDDLRHSYEEHVAMMTAVNEKEQVLQTHINNLVFTLYKVSTDSQEIIGVDPWVVRGHEQLCKIPTFKHCLKELLQFIESSTFRDIGLKERFTPNGDLESKTRRLVSKTD